MSSLDARQSDAFQAFRKGKCLALLGGAGCGKSFLMDRIIEFAYARNGHFPHVAPCAPTNRVAEELNGRTLHSLFGAPPYWRWSRETLWDLIRRNPRRLQALQRLQVLIIDEIGLVAAGVLDTIDFVLRKLAANDTDAFLPFGGRQVVFAGDAFQLLPSPQPKKNSRHTRTPEEIEEDRPAYTARSWFLTFGGFGSGVITVLDANHRQAGDPFFYSILERIKIGKVTNGIIGVLNNSSKNKSLFRHYTHLCLRRKQAEQMNVKKPASISSKLFTSLAEDRYIVPKSAYISQRLDYAAPSSLMLKKGCDVLLLVCADGILPGTRATVHDILVTPCISGVSAIQLEHENGISTITMQSFSIRDWDTTVLAVRKQFPLLPAYAVTVHRCQGVTLSTVAMDFSCASQWKPPGMVYVALSRCRQLQDVCVSHLTKSHIVVSEEPLGLLRKLVRLKDRQPFRVIGLLTSSASISPLLEITPKCLTMEKFSRAKRRRIGSRHLEAHDTYGKENNDPRDEKHH